MIELYLIRHGVAEERGEEWPDDTKRPLSQEGIAKLRKAARALTRLDVEFDVMVDEPARAHQADRGGYCGRTRHTRTL